MKDENGMVFNPGDKLFRIPNNSTLMLIDDDKMETDDGVQPAKTTHVSDKPKQRGMYEDHKTTYLDSEEAKPKKKVLS